MWKSYHIYKTDYDGFLDKVNNLKQKFVEDDNSLFFTLYTDMKGPHYRLRIRRESIKNTTQFYKELSYEFSETNIEERIYDPEIIKYGSNLQTYELFSTVISNYIITNRKEFISENKIANLLLGLMQNILEEFNLYDAFQIESSIGFWNTSKNFFRATINHQIYSQLFPEYYFSDYIKELIKSLSVTSINEARELCFNFIHLAVNRFNFNLKDECLLYYKLYELKGG